MKKLVCSIAAIPLFLVFVTAGRAQSSGGELDLGVAAYENGDYQEATRHFEKAVELDPGSVRAHIYLATAYLQQYIPGVTTAKNEQFGQDAIEQYQHVLDSSTTGQWRINSAKGIAYLDLNLKKFDDSKKYYRMASDLDPDDPEPYYSIGVIDWTECYQPRMEARAELGMNPTGHLNSRIPEQKKVCDELKIKNTRLIEEGMDNLTKAIQFRPDYDDAMAYINLMFREKADLECDNPAARSEDLATADHWVDEVLRVRKARAEKSKALEKLTAPNPQ